MMLVRGLTDPSDAGRVAERLRASLTKPFRIAGQPMKVTASVGVATLDGQSVDDLLTRADQAMYKAKRLGRNRVASYTDDLGAQEDHQSSLAHELPFALQRGQLGLVFQPICSMDGAIVEAEALLRWNHPVFGGVSPAEFIPLAEEAGLIETIGAWVLQKATRQCARWRIAGTADAAVSVNVSAFQLTSGFPAVVRDALESCDLPPDAVKLEITESSLIGDAEAAGVLEELGRMGIGLEIDDFGSGYSSLAYLRRFPVQTLKIDRSFVSGLGRSGSDESIVRAMIDLAHTIGLTVVAEGVEECNELEALRAMGCDRVQGYLLGRPAPGKTLDWSIPLG